MFVVDTNTLTDYFHGKDKLVSKFQEMVRNDEIVVITCISYFEILMKGRYQSVLTASDSQQLLLAAKRLEQDEFRLEAFDILMIDEVVAETFGELLAQKKLKKIGRADLLIGCISLANNATLVTRNTKDFEKIPNLKIDNWAV